MAEWMKCACGAELGYQRGSIMHRCQKGEDLCPRCSAHQTVEAVLAKFRNALESRRRRRRAR